MEKKLFTDMTRVTLVIVHLNRIVESALRENLTEESFLEERREVEELSGLNETRPADKNILTPFVEEFLGGMGEWVKNKKRNDALFRYIKILNGEEECSYSGKCPNLSEDANHAPTWFKQVLEIGKRWMTGDFSADEKEKERAAFLLRSIPIDTVFGYLSHVFVRGLFQTPCDENNLERTWKLLSGEKPLQYRITVKSPFVRLQW